MRAQHRFKNQIGFESLLRGTGEASTWRPQTRKTANWVPGVVGGPRLMKLESQRRFYTLAEPGATAPTSSRKAKPVT